MKRVLFIIAIILVSCSKEPYKYSTAKIQFYEGDTTATGQLETIYVAYGTGNFQSQPNGKDFTVEYKSFIQDSLNMARMSVSSNEGFSIDYGYVSTFNNLGPHGIEDDQVEIDWKKEANSFSAVFETKVLPVDFVEVVLNQKNY